MADTILQTFPLGFQWPTVDPYLFCVHHLDHYPAGNAEFGPAASLAGRNIGSDFELRDGWRMYHGSVVPGFPAHPHRGFETVTFVRQGLIDHADSLGAAARYGRGDVQWMTAGRGIVHAEMMPLLDAARGNTVELFQIWMNLPAADKMVEPSYTMLWDGDIPRVSPADGVTVTVIAGALGGVTPPPPPPSSWASRPDSDVAIWHLVLEPGSTWTLPPAVGPETLRVLYPFDGAIAIDGVDLGAATGAVVDAHAALEVRATERAEILMLQGRRIGEPLAQYGPFVMNTRAEIEQAFADYRATEFGGWPWDRSDPVHGAEPRRFARHADGRTEEP